MADFKTLQRARLLDPGRPHESARQHRLCAERDLRLLAARSELEWPA